jgi:VanZ family protein
MLLPLRFPRLWLNLGWAFVALVLAACLVPNGVPGTAGVNDKVLHAAGYLALTLWFTGIYPRSRYVWIAASLVIMGIIVELLQGAMQVGRNADARDVIANIIGIAVGVVLSLSLLGGWMQRIETWVALHER